jgi:hypothetical protein
MTSAVSSFQFSLRTLLLVVTAIAACLGALVWIGIDFRPLLATALILCVFSIALMLAAMQFDQDVVHMAAIGMVAGFGLALWTGNTGSEFGLALGLIVGALAGDTIRELRTSRWADAGPTRWWQHVALEPRWIGRIVWAVAFVGAVLIVLLGAICVVHRPSILDDLFEQFMAVRSETSWLHSILRVWYSNILLLMALLPCWLVWRGAKNEAAAERLLRRVAVLHCFGLLLFAGGAAWELMHSPAWTNNPPYNFARMYREILWTIASVLRQVQVPVLLIMLGLVLLRNKFRLYLHRYGWMTALGFIGLAAVACVAFQMSYVLQ